MTFKEPSDIQCVLSAGRDIERVRSANRVVINNMLNGQKPFDDATAKSLGLNVNVNWGEGVVLAQQARRQFMNAFERGSRYFHVGIPDAPPEKKFEFEQFITSRLNRTMKNSRAWLHLGDNWRAAAVAHGIGPRMWNNKENWLPEFVAIDDLRVPTNTLTSFENCDWFARRCWYSEGELAGKAFGENKAPGWNKEAIADICHRIHDYNYEDLGVKWAESPERMAQLLQQNGGFYTSDAAPTIPLWHFYYRDYDEKENEKWCLRVVVDTELGSIGDPDVFMYESDRTQADNLGQLLSVQVADTNNTAPLLLNATRSLGFQLVEPCFWSNLTRCRMMQHLNDQFNIWLRNNDPSDRSRAMAIEFFDKCIIPPGVSVVPQTERHMVNPQLIEMAMAQVKQLQSEVSSSYTSQADTGTNKEQTAYETAVKVAQVNAMMSGMLLTAMRTEKYLYMEICRRFCIRDSRDKDVRKFQKEAEEAGIPARFLNSDLWDIEPEQPLGAGNPTMEMSQAQQLMAMRGAYPPESQQKILNMVTTAITGSSSMAQDLAPVNVQPVTTNGQKWAASIFGSLMQGVPVPQNEQVAAIEQIDTLIGMLAGAITLCEQQGNVCTRQQLNGFAATLGYCQQLVAQIATDESKGHLAKQYSQQLGELANILKGFAQRLQEEEQASQVDPEKQAKIINMAQAAQVKTAATVEKNRQQLQHKQESFAQAQQQKAEAHAMDQQIIAREAAMNARIQKLEADLAAAKAQVEINATQAKALADIEATKAKAKESPSASSQA